MIVICTGISGVGKKGYLSRLHTAHSEKTTVFDVGEKMLEHAKHLNIETSTEKILDMPESTQVALRSSVFESVLGELEKATPDQHYFISLHACFRWNNFLTLGFNAYHLKQITELAREKNIHLVYVCFTDTAPEIYARLQQRRQWKEHISFDEMLLWRDEERALTEMIAEYERADFYALPSEEPVDTLWKLVSDPHIKKLYLSFPITIIKKYHPEYLEEVGTLRERLRQNFVVFDPLAVKDIEWQFGEFQVDGVSPPSATARRYMENQTVQRDFQLIDQSDFVVVYYRTDRLSFGVVAEMIHGYTHDKPVYAIYTSGLSPFLTYYCTERTDSVEEMMSLIDKIYRRKTSS